MRSPGKSLTHSSCIAYAARSTPDTVLGDDSLSPSVAQPQARTMGRSAFKVLIAGGRHKDRKLAATFARRAQPLPRPPIFEQHRPPLVVAPAAIDLQIAARKTFAHESTSTHQCDRAPICGLDVALDPMQAHVQKCVTQHELEAFAHISVAGVRRQRVVAEISAL